MDTISEQEAVRYVKAHGCVDEKGYAVRAGQVGERKNLFSKDQ